MNTVNIKDESFVDVNILIAVPSGDEWSSQFGMALAAMLFYYAQVPVLKNVRKQQVVLLNRRSSMLGQSRESLYEEAVERGCTHVLWLDSDMVFPENTVHQLVQHGRTFVGANYVKKAIPASPVTAAIGGGLTFTDADTSGLEEVLHIGFGVSLLRLADLEEVKAPRFLMEWNEELGVYSGEDVFFCKKLRELGLPVYVDHDLSHEVQHVGVFNYDHSVVGEVVNESHDPANKIILES